MTLSYLLTYFLYVSLLTLSYFVYLFLVYLITYNNIVIFCQPISCLSDQSISSLFSMRTSLVIKAAKIQRVLQFETPELRIIRENMLLVETDMMVQSSSLKFPGVPAKSINWNIKMNALIFKLSFSTVLVSLTN